MEIKEESISVDTGVISTPKAFDKKVDEALPKVTGADSGKGKAYIPKAFEFPKILLQPFEGVRHFKISSNGNKSVLSVSPLAKIALESIEKGRTSFEKEEKLTSLTRWLKEKMPAQARGAVKKYTGTTKSSDGYFPTSLILTQTNPDAAQTEDRILSITDSGINMLRDIKNNPTDLKGISHEAVFILSTLYRNRQGENKVSTVADVIGVQPQKVNTIVNSLGTAVKAINPNPQVKTDNWYIINPIKGDNTQSDLGVNLYEIVKDELLKESAYNKFKKDVTFRTKSEQLHKAIREVKRKLQEVDRIVEYTSRMKQELSEGDEGIKYWKATQKNVAAISEMVNHLNNKLKNLNE